VNEKGEKLQSSIMSDLKFSRGCKNQFGKIIIDDEIVQDNSLPSNFKGHITTTVKNIIINSKYGPDDVRSSH
jgi:hypothetical protein